MAEQLINSFTVNRPIDEAWPLITDVERIAPCLPGAELQEVEGETYRGVVKVKLGAISSQFKGEAHFIERDDANYRAVIKGAGRDTGGRGNASAEITAQAQSLSPTSTRVDVTTDLHITGKVAQFGRGIMGDVSSKLMAQFADNLNQMIDEEGLGAPAAAGSGDHPRGLRRRPEHRCDVGSSVGRSGGHPAQATGSQDRGPRDRAHRPDGGRWQFDRQAHCACGHRADRAVARAAPPSSLMDDRARVAQLLGREPQSAFDVVVRDHHGDPVVVRNAPFLDDGTPMPTRFYLVGADLVTRVSRLEAAGGVRQAEAEIDPDEITRVHERYAAERDAAIDPDHVGPRPHGGVGGTRTGVKCLHAHVAYCLAGGDDPIGRWAIAQLERNPDPGGMTLRIDDHTVTVTLTAADGTGTTATGADETGTRRSTLPIGPVALLDGPLGRADPPSPASLTNALGLVTDHLDDIIIAAPAMAAPTSVVAVGEHALALARVEIGHALVPNGYELVARRCRRGVPHARGGDHRRASPQPRARSSPRGVDHRHLLRDTGGHAPPRPREHHDHSPDRCDDRCDRRCDRRCNHRCGGWSLMALRHPARTSSPVRLYGRRVMLRPLAASDFRAWSEVRQRNAEWLTVWEPSRPLHQADPVVDRERSRPAASSATATAQPARRTSSACSSTSRSSARST